MSQDDGMRETSASTDGRSSGDAERRELQNLHERMGVIREEVTADVERKWTTPWRTPAVFDLKVTTRLMGHTEYRSLRVRIEQVEAALAAQPNTGMEKAGV